MHEALCSHETCTNYNNNSYQKFSTNTNHFYTIKIWNIRFHIRFRPVPRFRTIFCRRGFASLGQFHNWGSCVLHLIILHEWMNEWTIFMNEWKIYTRFYLEKPTQKRGDRTKWQVRHKLIFITFGHVILLQLYCFCYINFIQSLYTHSSTIQESHFKTQFNFRHFDR